MKQRHRLASGCLGLACQKIISHYALLVLFCFKDQSQRNKCQLLAKTHTHTHPHTHTHTHTFNKQGNQLERHTSKNTHIHVYTNTCTWRSMYTQTNTQTLQKELQKNEVHTFDRKEQYCKFSSSRSLWKELLTEFNGRKSSLKASLQAMTMPMAFLVKHHPNYSKHTLFVIQHNGHEFTHVHVSTHTHTHTHTVHVYRPKGSRINPQIAFEFTHSQQSSHHCH